MPTAKPSSDARPNILFVFADQMRAMDMGCAGNPAVPTPAMDRLAREGVLFDNIRDPYQMRNLADDPAVAPARDRLTAHLRRRLPAVGDPFLDTAGMQARFSLPQWPASELPAKDE